MLQQTDDNFIMDIHSAYIISKKLQGFSEYKTPRFYQDTRKETKKLIPSFKSRTTWMNDVVNLSMQIPGPGQYNANPEEDKNKKKFKPKIDFFKQLKTSGRQTYLDAVLKRKSSLPSIGKYHIQESSVLKKSKSNYRNDDETRKKAPIFRPTVMDTINVDTLNVSPGSYELQKVSRYVIQSWINKNKHKKLQPKPTAKRSVSLPRLHPSSCDYNPIPVSYSTFSRKQSISSLKSYKSEHIDGRKMNVETIGPGPKYSLIIDWSPKKGKDGKYQGQNYLKSISTYRSQSVYH